MLKLFSKYPVVFGVFCLLFASGALGENSTNSPLKLSVVNIKKDIVPPVNNPKNYSDIEVTITFENTGKTPVQFDQIKAIFLTNNKPESASTYNWEATSFGGKALSGYYADGKSPSPPKVKPGLLITIEKGRKMVFQLRSANSQYGIIRSIFIKKELLLELYRNNKLSYDPYRLAIRL